MPIQRVNSASAVKYATLKQVTNISATSLQETFTLLSAAVTNASTNGLASLITNYQEWRPFKLTVQLIPRAADAQSAVCTMGCDFNENKAAQAFTDIHTKFGGSMHVMKEGRVIAKSLSYNSDKHKDWLKTSQTTSTDLAPWASAILVGFADTHISCDVMVHLTILVKGYGAGTN